MKQVQLPLAEVVSVVKGLCDNLLKWEDVLQKYPLYESAQEDQ